VSGGRLRVAKKINKESFKTLLTHVWRIVGRGFFFFFFFFFFFKKKKKKKKSKTTFGCFNLLRKKINRESWKVGLGPTIVLFWCSINSMGKLLPLR